MNKIKMNELVYFRFNYTEHMHTTNYLNSVKSCFSIELTGQIDISITNT